MRRLFSSGLIAIAIAPIVLLSFVLVWLWARRMMIEHEELDVEIADIKGRRIDVDGVSLHVVERGEGPAILLIHGLGASVFTWRKNIDALAQSFRVVAVDMLGFGYSQRTADADYSLGGHARRMVSLMDTLGIEDAVVVGHSLGGAVGQRMAAIYPERVRRLVLVNPATARETRGLSLLRYLLVFSPFFFAFIYQRRPMRRLMLANIYSGSSRVPDEVIDHYIELGRFKGHQRALASLIRDAASDKMPEPEELKLPVLIIWGEDDRLLPESRGRWLARRLPDVRLVVVPDAGHMTAEEQPEIVNREIAAFALEMKSEGEAAGF